jgi:hypothetical protein
MTEDGYSNGVGVGVELGANHWLSGVFLNTLLAATKFRAVLSQVITKAHARWDARHLNILQENFNFQKLE